MKIVGELHSNVCALPHVVQVGKNKCFVHIKTTCYDVLGVLTGEAMSLFQSKIPPYELFVISHLDH